MSSQSNKPNRGLDTSSTTRCIWVTLEPSEVIELKRIAMDNDIDSAVSFFCDVLIPRVRHAAAQRHVAQDMLEEDKNHERIPG
jgi:hypothetical protein